MELSQGTELNRKEKLNIRQLIYATVLFLYLLLTNAKVTSLYVESDSFRTILLVFLYISTVLEVLIFFIQYKRINFILLSMLVYSVYIILMLLFKNIFALDVIMTYLFFPITFILFYICTVKNGNDRTIHTMNVLQCICLLLFTGIFIQTQLLSGTSSRTAINTVYYIVVCFPSIFLLKNKYIRLPLIALTIFCAILSLKLGAILIIVVCYTVYFSLLNKNNTSRLFSILLRLLGVTIILAIVAFITTRIGDFAIINKISSSLSSGGSGRLYLWKETISNLASSEIVELMFGHTGSSSEYSSLNLSAHNDFLEIAWSLGLFGLSIFFWFLKGILKCIKRKVYCDNKASILGSNFFALLILMLISQVIFIPSYGAIIYANIGVLTAYLQNKKTTYC